MNVNECMIWQPNMNMIRVRVLCTVICIMIIISYGTARTFSDVQRAESSEFRKNYFIQKYGYSYDTVSYRPADSKKII